MKYIIIILIIIVILILSRIKDTFQNIKLKLKLADTDEKRERGLMYVKRMDYNKGMIFYYGGYRNNSMWMKNTFIPLDVLFLDKNKLIIDYVENTTPHSLKSINIDKPSWFVVELNSGSVRKFNLKKNTKLDYDLIDNS